MRPEVGSSLDAHYTGFYVEGLRRTFGSYRWVKPHLPLSHPALTAVVNGLRIYIDADDPPTIDEAGLEWCDVYGKVNAMDQTSAKVVPIGPGFGVRAWRLPQLVPAMAQTMSLCGPGRVRVARGFWRQWRYAQPEDQMCSSTAEEGYVFFVSSIWAKEPAANEARRHFMESAERHADVFEGGFAPRVDGRSYGMERWTMDRRVSYEDYLRRTRASALVFSTPAVAQCHGWKLAEYLALGKAVVQTPLTRLMPAPLEHGIHVHIAGASEDEIDDAVRLILRDAAYRHRLEVGARDYYQRYLAPQAVVQRLLTHAGA